MAEDKFREKFERELEKVRGETLFSRAYQRKKLIFWGIRTLLIVILYVVLWRYQWIRWSLIAYIPLNLYGLFSIYGWPFLISRKINKTQEKIEEVEHAILHAKAELGESLGYVLCQCTWPAQVMVPVGSSIL